MSVTQESDMPPTLPKTQRPPGHIFQAGGTIGLLAMVLSVGLSLLGLIDRINHWISDIITQGNEVAAVKFLPPWTLWLVVMVAAFAIPWTLLCVPGLWRRWVLWLSSLVVLAGWIPVLGLAAYFPEVAAPFIAAVWSGLCAMVYARNHLMPYEILPTEGMHETR